MPTLNASSKGCSRPEIPIAKIRLGNIESFWDIFDIRSPDGKFSSVIVARVTLLVKEPLTQVWLSPLKYEAPEAIAAVFKISS